MDFAAEDVRELVSEGEGRRLEFKRGLPRGERVARTLCAFANTSGGILLVGVTDRGGILGVESPREVASALRAIARELVLPPLEVQVSLVVLDTGRVACCSVPLSPARPHAVLHDDGRTEVVVRVGSSNRAAQGATLRAISLPTSHRGLEPLERRILAWVGERSGGQETPNGDATAAGFARAHNVGIQRARRAFTRLESEGRLIAHGPRGKRVYATP